MGVETYRGLPISFWYNWEDSTSPYATSVSLRVFGDKFKEREVTYPINFHVEDDSPIFSEDSGFKLLVSHGIIRKFYRQYQKSKEMTK